MRLRFFYQPVTDLEDAATFYRDVLGWTEAWREGTTTAAFTMPGSDLSIMLDEDPSEPAGGPFLVVEDVRAFYEENKGRLDFIEEPVAIAPGMYARFTDPSGNVIRIMDDTTSRERAGD